MENRLPGGILSRPKQGFMFPIAHWFQTELAGFLESFFTDAWSIQEGILNHDTVLELVREHRSGATDHHVRLWMLMNFEVWCRLFLAGDGVSQVQESIARHLVDGGSGNPE